METITVDKNRCKKDGICQRECPMGLISKGDDGFPKIDSARASYCLACGHCVAVCPTGSLSHSCSPIEETLSIDKNLKSSFQQAQQFLRSRRSIRFYKEKKVERQKIQRLIEIARYAPSGTNRQPVQWQVFTDSDQIDEIAKNTIDYLRDTVKKRPDYPTADLLNAMILAWDMGLNTITWKAPVLIIASAPKLAVTGHTDIALALSYLELMATTMDLGTCWAGVLQEAIGSWPQLRDIIALPEDHFHFYPMVLGYPKRKYYRLPERKTPTIIWR